MKTMIFLPLMFSFCQLIEAGVLASGMKAPEGAFWLTTDLIDLTFTPGCLSTKYCVEPAFKITQSMTSVHESPSMSWPITENLTKDGRKHTFVTYWTTGEPKMVSFSAEVTGKDPSFGFSRDCDRTPETKVFHRDNAYFHSNLGLRSRRHLGHDNRVEAQVADGALEVNLVGSCFNATFAIIKHIERCPWCPDEHVVISEKDEVNQPQTMSFSFKDQTFLFGIAIVTMSLIIVIIGIIICFCILRCNKRKANNFKNQKQANINMYHQRPLPQGQYYTMKQKVELLKKPHADEDEHHYQVPVLPNENRDNGYDAPWDRKFRPGPQYWNGSVSHKSEVTMTSPIGSSSAIGSMSDRTFGGGNSGCSLPGINHYSSGSVISANPHSTINPDGTVRIPLNFHATSPISSSGSNRHDDSGLESV